MAALQDGGISGLRAGDNLRQTPLPFPCTIDPARHRRPHADQRPRLETEARWL